MNDRPTRQLDQRWANGAVVLIVVGALFLLGELFDFRVGGWIWPFLILLPGLVLLAAAFRGEHVNTGPAVPGAVLTTLGLIFFYQETSGHWESWAYIWALLPLSVGAVLFAAGTRNDDTETLANGRRMLQIFGTLFVVGLVFFELLIFDRGGFAGWFLPLVLIAAGAAILWMYYQQHGSFPWNGIGPQAEPTTPPSAPSAPAPASPAPATSNAPAASASPPPPAPTASTELFPEDTLPHEPASDSASFPGDEHAPAAKPPASTPKPKRRRTTARKTSTAGTPDTKDNSS